MVIFVVSQIPVVPGMSKVLRVVGWLMPRMAMKLLSK